MQLSFSSDPSNFGNLKLFMNSKLSEEACSSTEVTHNLSSSLFSIVFCKRLLF